MTRLLRALVGGAAAALLALVLAAPASAEAFRYWGYYTSDGDAWTFAPAGPADTVPADGSVEGWRFAVTGEESVRYPRAAPDVDLLCAGVQAADGDKRVGVVLDYGTGEDAPDGEAVPAARGACAVVPADATGADVLAAVAELRLGDGGFVCGIDGYPAAGCGDPVEGEAPSGDEQPVTLELAETTGSGSTSWLPVVVGVGVVAAVGAAAVALTRRRSTDEPR
jgi:hypothetical protein